MKFHQHFSRIASLIISAFVAVGCGDKTDVNTALVKTIKVLEQRGPAQPAPAQASPATPATQPAQQVSQALIAFKEGKYMETIVQMEMARSNPNKTPQQMIAIQDAMASVMSDLYARAAKGDAAAKEAIKRYNEERNRR